MSVLTIDVHVEASGTVVVHPHGEIDSENAAEVRELVTARLAGQPTPAGIKIDLSAVGFIDSVGIGALVGCFHTAAASGVTLTVVNPTTYVHRILYISGLLGLFGSPAVATSHRSPVPPAARLEADAAR
jgi:anti-anti-sigma factor